VRVPFHDERLGMLRCGAARRAAETAEERFLVEPVVHRLGRVVLVRQPGLLHGHIGFQRLQ
jgi:hypothetical protein